MAFSPIVAASLALTLGAGALAETVWSGFDFSYSKSANANPGLAANQDRITDNVWLTRRSSRGLFNASQESAYASASPKDTEWATDFNNPGKSIAATNWADLSFTSWVNAYQGLQSHELPSRLTSRNAVVHLITDDIYLDLRFTSWSMLGGGTFSYQRAVGTLPVTPGDYNLDGSVDAADYIVWRKGQNTIYTQTDYDVWRAHFGETAGSGEALPSAEPTSVAVPEPAARMPLVIAIVLFVSRRQAVGASASEAKCFTAWTSHLPRVRCHLPPRHAEIPGRPRLRVGDATSRLQSRMSFRELRGTILVVAGYFIPTCLVVLNS